MRESAVCRAERPRVRIAMPVDHLCAQLLVQQLVVRDEGQDVVRDIPCIQGYAEHNRDAKKAVVPILKPGSPPVPRQPRSVEPGAKAGFIDPIEYRLEIDVPPFCAFIGVGCRHPNPGRRLHGFVAN